MRPACGIGPGFLGSIRWADSGSAAGCASPSWSGAWAFRPWPAKAESPRGAFACAWAAAPMPRRLLRRTAPAAEGWPSVQVVPLAGGGVLPVAVRVLWNRHLAALAVAGDVHQARQRGRHAVQDRVTEAQLGHGDLGQVVRLPVAARKRSQEVVVAVDARGHVPQADQLVPV